MKREKSMANSIYMNDGSVEYIFNEEGTIEYYNDFQKIIYEKLGRDAEQVIIQLRNDADYTEWKVNTDIVAYESQLESNASCFLTILELLQEIDTILSKHRLNKKELLDIITEIRKNINNQI